MNKAQHLTAVWRNGGCSASYDSFVVNQTSVFQIKFCAKNPALRVAANRQSVKKLSPSIINCDFSAS